MPIIAREDQPTYRQRLVTWLAETWDDDPVWVLLGGCVLALCAVEVVALLALLIGGVIIPLAVWAFTGPGPAVAVCAIIVAVYVLTWLAVRLALDVRAVLKAKNGL